MTHALSGQAGLISKDHNGLSFVFREDGWFNMTKAAKHFGKRLDHFWENVSNVEYMVALADILKVNPGNPGITPDFKSSDYYALKGALVETQKGYHTKDNVGSWGHPKLAVFFARWLDVKFSVWCDAVIEDILKGNAQLTITNPAQSSVLALPPEVTLKIDQLSKLVASLSKEVSDLKAGTSKPIKMPTLRSLPVPKGDPRFKPEYHAVGNDAFLSVDEFLNLTAIGRVPRVIRLGLGFKASRYCEAHLVAHHPSTVSDAPKYPKSVLADAAKAMRML